MKKKNQKSLRSVLTLWFLTFTIVPISFISGYSLVLYESSLNSELQKRLDGDIREVAVTITELERTLLLHSLNHAEDPTLVYHVATRNLFSARRVVSEWLKTSLAGRIVLFDREGRLIVSLKREAQNEIRSQTQLEGGDFFLSDELLTHLSQKTQHLVREVKPEKSMELIVYSKILQKDGKTAGFIEEVLELGNSFTQNLGKRLGLEVVLFDTNVQPAAASTKDFFFYPKDYFLQKLGKSNQTFIDINQRGEPLGMIIKKLVDSQNRNFAVLGLAASKRDSEAVLKRIKVTLGTVALLILALLIPTLIYVSNRVLKPIHLLVDATQRIEKGKGPPKLETSNDTEVGLLVESFNRMSQTISQQRKDLEFKISELGQANSQIKNTQMSLVQSAKMASLGQLVAGVAHELNNPISFIYTNMVHLREYMDKLNKLIQTVEKDPKQIAKVKKEIDYDYILEDLPKLIASCEDGARRTRDIVLGLRNFSRLDEAQLKKVDLHEGLRNTLKLLSSELKNRIQVHETFGKVDEIRCYPSQLNQVFMNIISNSAQAIKDTGNIWIKTSQKGSDAFVSIKDDGPGIEKEHLDRIFDPFFTTKPVGQGTGLGLSISYGIVQKHGGDISVTSDPGQGTEFIIRIPVGGPPDESGVRA
ncbi:MAG: HAMP domain-containing protein [Oligoflexia bacterium]|nr:HAMP domain-containing protein [Oligoflexia bacterium]